MAGRGGERGGAERVPIGERRRGRPGSGKTRQGAEAEPPGEKTVRTGPQREIPGFQGRGLPRQGGGEEDRNGEQSRSEAQNEAAAFASYGRLQAIIRSPLSKSTLAFCAPVIAVTIPKPNDG